MNPSLARESVIPVLSGFNPWWRQEPVNVPEWKRSVFKDMYGKIKSPHRALFLSGARQTGKTTLFRQAIKHLLEDGVPAANILFATFDHPILKMEGLDCVLSAWRERIPKADGPEYLFLDELQVMPDWSTWVKHKVDFHPNQHIFFTGSAMPLTEKGGESGFGRLSTLSLETLSFYEFLQIRKESYPSLPQPQCFEDLFEWPDETFHALRESLETLNSLFHRYLLWGGFPQLARLDSLTEVQRLLREDVVDKALKRDMTAFYGVRNIAEIELLFLYLCQNEGILDPKAVISRLGGNRNTLNHHLSYLESSHLIRLLRPFGFGKEILKGKQKVYLTDPAIGPAVYLKGESLLENETELGGAIETCVLKHLFSGSLIAPHHLISWWRDGSQGYEVDFIIEPGGGRKPIPLEVKYRSAIKPSDLKGLQSFCKKHATPKACVVTRHPQHVGLMTGWVKDLPTQVMRIPASLFCFWNQ